MGIFSYAPGARQKSKPVNTMKVYLGADHGGFERKEHIKSYLDGLGYDVEDAGAHTLDTQDDYPQFAKEVAGKVAADADSRGILFCRSGIGMDITANKVRGARCAQIFTVEMAKKSREHNDANVLSIATDYIPEEDVLEIVKTWLETPFSKDERHARRIAQIETQ